MTVRNRILLRLLPAALLIPAGVARAAEAADDHAPRALMDLVWHEWLFSLIVFGLFFAVLSLVVWPKILAALRAREQKQRSDLKAAENAAQEAQATLAEYKQQLAEARREAQEIIERSRADAQRVAAQLKQEAQHEITQMRQRAEADIAAAGEQAIAGIYEQAAALSTQIAGRILRREIDPATHRALVEQSLEQMSSRRN